MDFSHRHLAQMPRQFDLLPKVLGIGYMSAKTSWVHNEFNTFNYSFILRGGGRYRKDGREWEVVAPCVITQWPQVYLEYGPVEPWTFWEELFIMYRPEHLERIHAAHLADPDRPVWPIRQFGRLIQKVAELEQLLRDTPDTGLADRIDQVCLALVMESLLAAAQAPAANVHEEAIRAIRQYVRKHCLEAVDFQRLASERGLSGTSFRRYWTRYVGISPARYLMRLRLRESCRLLVETSLTIAEVAQRVQFSDPLYFSRKFHKEMGVAPTRYRCYHQFHQG